MSLMERAVDQVSEPLQWRPQVRRTEADQHAAGLRPVEIGCGLLAGIAGDQPAHAVPDQHQLRDLFRPCGQQCLDQCCQSSAVVGDRESGVVAQVKRRVAQLVLQTGAEIDFSVVGRLPAVLIECQSMDEQAEPLAGSREGEVEGLGGERYGTAIDMEAHVDGQDIADAGEVVAEGGVERAAQAADSAAGEPSASGN